MVDDNQTQSGASNEPQTVKRRNVLKAAGVGLGGLSSLAFMKKASADPPEFVDLPDPVSTLPASYRPGAQGVTVCHPKDKKTRDLAQQVGIRMVALAPSEHEDGNQQVILGRNGDAAEFGVLTDPDSQTYQFETFEPIDEPASSGDVSTMAMSNYGPVRIMITTHDGVGCKLARTHQALRWAYNSNYRATYITDRNKWGRAWNPVKNCPGAWLKTRWYVDWTRWAGRGSSQNRCHTRCTGQHWNANFQSNNKRTYTWHKIHITGYGGGGNDWWTTADHWGEGSGLLHTRSRKF